MLGAGQPRPPRLLATSASWASTQPTPARCRCRTCPAPGSPDTCDPLPGLVPWPSSWCSPAAVDLAGPDPLPLLDVPGTGRPRPLRPAGYARELGEHLASAGPSSIDGTTSGAWVGLPSRLSRIGPRTEKRGTFTRLPWLHDEGRQKGRSDDE
ncbi:hypothetical protein ABIC99_000251 [Sphaerotilus sulfidivorans]|uniref:Uncharacterized protein n=1 Tax=Sphaerotilus sulfidivorans TaxID=639200 RepID=A0ABV2IHS4_9BURK